MDAALPGHDDELIQVVALAAELRHHFPDGAGLNDVLEQRGMADVVADIHTGFLRLCGDIVFSQGATRTWMYSVLLMFLLSAFS